MNAPTEPQHYRALFLSDIHLGTRGCQAGLLLDFLRVHDAETVYLVGDIVDGWRLRKGWHWPQEHNNVVQKLLRKARKGARIVYVSGNHDEFLRDYLGTNFGGVEVMDSCLHETAVGEKFLVIHGDQFDVVVRHAKWLAFLGDWAYVTALNVNTGVTPSAASSAFTTGRCRLGPSSRSRTRSISSAGSRRRWRTRRAGAGRACAGRERRYSSPIIRRLHKISRVALMSSRWSRWGTHIGEWHRVGSVIV